MGTSAKVELLLRKMGANATMLGYGYTIRCVSKIMEDETWLHQVCQLYQAIANEAGVSDKSVERSIRFLVNSIWESENGHKLLAQLACYKLERKPSTGQFLEMVVFWAKNPDLFADNLLE